MAKKITAKQRKRQVQAKKTEKVNIAKARKIISSDYSDIRTKKFKDLRKDISIITDVANQQLNELEKSDISKYSNALRNNEKPFKKSFRSRNELLTEFQRATNFLNSKSSSVEGTKEIITQQLSRMGMSYNTENIERLEKMYEIANELKNNDPAFNAMNLNSEQKFSMIMENIDGEDDFDTTYAKVKENLVEAYEERNREREYLEKQGGLEF